ncbi:hypothetical protein [Legionella maceachernii]|uniref:F-box domain-containing protein n=1 Tax=Legionella maceachernii TaxID=466 RepID=A0A0W0W1T1_9GAMM|nr:hypothetical protein [Legionella maceachernii]KTD26189.1 hypothetical protein Lmac_1557 [Legionella maceachernii]SJZ72453.1 hypothetical protein SAMN02745128_00921 [Legionella maceachernii]SUP02435.1 Uncharacterised protein [Legionella maceachernii]
MSGDYFFNQAPVEILLKIYAELSSEDLYKKCRLINRRQRKIAELALFAKRDDESIRYQEALLEAWAADLIGFMKGRDEASLMTLAQEIFKSIKTPQATPKYRLHGLMVIGAIKGFNFTLADSMIPKITANLKRGSLSSWQSAKCFSALILALSERQVDKIMTLLQREMMLRQDLDDDSAVKQHLRVLVPHLTSTQVIRFIRFILANLNHEVSNKVMLQSLALFVPRLGKDQLAKLIPILFEKLNSTDENEVAASLECLAAFAPQLNESGIEAFIPLLRERINSETMRRAVLLCLTAFAPKLGEIRLIELFPVVCECLDNSPIQFSAERCLAAFALRINEKKLTELSLPVLSIFKRYYNPSSLAEFKWVTIFAPAFNEAKLFELTLSFTHVQDWVQIPTSIESQLSEKKLQELVAEIPEKLTSQNEVIQLNALFWLLQIGPRLTKAQKLKFGLLICDRISGSRTANAAKNCLIQYVREFNPLQPNSLLFIKIREKWDSFYGALSLYQKTIFASMLTETELIEIISTLSREINGLNGLGSTVNTIPCIKNLLPRLANDQFGSLISLVFAKLKDKNQAGTYIAHALEELIDLLPKLNETQLQELAQIVVENLKEEEVDRRYVATKLACQLIISNQNFAPLLVKNVQNHAENALLMVMTKILSEIEGKATIVNTNEIMSYKEAECENDSAGCANLNGIGLLTSGGVTVIIGAIVIGAPLSISLSLGLSLIALGLVMLVVGVVYLTNACSNPNDENTVELPARLSY